MTKVRIFIDIKCLILCRLKLNFSLFYSLSFFFLGSICFTKNLKRGGSKPEYSIISFTISFFVPISDFACWKWNLVQFWRQPFLWGLTQPYGKEKKGENCKNKFNISFSTLLKYLPNLNDVGLKRLVDSQTKIELSDSSSSLSLSRWLHPKA